MRVTLGNGINGSLTWPRALCPPAAPSIYRRHHAAVVAIPASSSGRCYSDTAHGAEFVSLRAQSNPHRQHDGRSHPFQPRRDRQLDDIVPGDLAATLKAHQQSNLLRAFPHVRRIKRVRREGSDGPQFEWVRLRSFEGMASETPSSPIATPSGAQADNRQPRTEKPLDVKFYFLKRTNRAGLQRKSAQPMPRHGNASYGRIWESNNTLATSDRRERLNMEIKNFADWIVPNQEEAAFYGVLAPYLCFRLEHKVPGASNFQIFGSQTTGLATSGSDIDIKFNMPSLNERGAQRGPSSSLGRPQNRRLVLKTLNQFGNWFNMKRRYGECEVVDARVPLLQASHLPSGVQLQLVYGNEQVDVTDQIQAYLAEYPQLAPVYFLINTALGTRSLGKPISGGLGSFSLLMMIVASFKHTKLLRRDDSVEALLRFLDFYDTLDTTEHCISADPPTKFAKRGPYRVLSLEEKEAAKTDTELAVKNRLRLRSTERPWALCLQDPTDITNDLGKSCARFREIKALISKFAAVTRSWLDGDDTNEAKPETPMSFFFGYRLEPILDRRERFREFFSSESGQEEMALMRRYIESRSSHAYSASHRVGDFSVADVADSSPSAAVFARARNIKDQLARIMVEFRTVLFMW